MLNKIHLSIVIPTFNRYKSLVNTLEYLRPLFGVNGIEITVIDNFSTDNTWNWLTENHEMMGISIFQNPFNLGIEGNIIQGLVNASGDYIWLLSDHMVVEVSEVFVLLEKLKLGLNFDFGYARINQYTNVLSSTYTPVSLNELSQYSIGEYIFYLGNISAFVINRNFLNRCGRTIFRFAGTSYPQLGTFAHVGAETIFVEFPVISSFSWAGIDKRRISYDTFRSRFIGFVNAINEIRRLNKRLYNINSALQTRILIRALALDSVSNLCFNTNNPVKCHEFVFCMKHYKGKIKFFLLLCSTLALMPSSVRMKVSRFLFNHLFPHQYKAVKIDYQSQFITEMIKE